MPAQPPRKRSLEFGGRTRTWVEVPGGDTGTLILFLHGSRQSGNVARNFTDRTFESLGHTVLYPDGVGRHFNDLRRGFQESARTLDVDDVGFLTELLALYPCERVVGCGFSNGGQMLIRMLFDAPSTLDAVALFGASMPAEDNTLPPRDPANEWHPTPILSVQGTADPLVPYDGGMAGIGGNNRGITRSAIDSAAFFAHRNGHTGAASHRRASLGAHVVVDSWDSPAPGTAPVHLVTIEGFGHMVPCAKDLDPRLGPGTREVTGAGLVEKLLLA